ncbi:hypothetical protein ACFLVX_00075 [Chloroflexota bacterium]
MIDAYQFGEIVVQPTDEACQTYNQLCSSQRVVAALHLPGDTY